MLNALNKEVQLHAHAYLTILEIPMLSVNPNVQSTLSVQMTSLASTTNVKIPVLGYVVFMPHVVLPIIYHNVLVILDILEMLLLHVQGLQPVS